MINWMISIMVHKKLLTLEEGEHLAARLVSTTHPSLFKEAHKIVEDVMNELEKKK
jgi:hypothetical protein